MKLHALCLIILIIFAPQLWASESISWFVADFPPLHIFNGPDKGKGAADIWGNYIRTHLPEFQQEVVNANVARLMEEIKRRDNVCNFALLRNPEREKLFIFSDKLVDLMPNGLIILQSRKAEFQPYMTPTGEIRLTDAIADRKFRIGVAASRSFGATIDGILHADNAQGIVIPFLSSDIFTSGLMKVANKQALDGVIGYAIELSFASRHTVHISQPFVFIPIAEDTTLTPTYIGCSKSARGERIIARVNEVIRNGGADVATEAYRNWLPADIRSYYDAQRKAPAKSKSSK